MNRRTFLQALGLTSGSLMLPSLKAHAAGDGPAKRIIFYMTGHGTVYENWKMRTGGHGENVDFEIDIAGLGLSDFSPILQPLHAHRNKLLVLDGLGNCSGITTAFNEHEEGHASILTGRYGYEVSGSIANTDGPSIDQAIAAAQATPFRSLEYNLWGWPVNFDQSGNALPYQEDIYEAWDQLFPSGMPDDAPTDADRIRMRQTSVLDLAARRFEALESRVNAEDRAKLESHRALIRDLENRIGALMELECEAIERPQYSDEPDWRTGEYAIHYIQTFFELAAAAMSCGLTNVATVRSEYVPDDLLDITADEAAEFGGIDDLHNDVAHVASSNPVAGAIMTRYHTYHATRFAALLDLLDSIPEAGGTMLDNTICVWGNELATGEHTFEDIPVVLAGATDFLRTGRYVRWRPKHQMQGPWSEPWIGEPHNKLLTTLGVGMGLDIDRFGVSQFLKADGSQLDATGTLPEVCG